MNFDGWSERQIIAFGFGVFMVLGCLVWALEHQIRQRRNKILPPPHFTATRSLTVGCVGQYDVQEQSFRRPHAS